MRNGKIRKALFAPAAALIGILIFLAICGPEPLRFSGDGWMIHGIQGHDIMQHYTGWLFYRNSPWSFPLCKALFLGYPEGTSIAYTDSIPLVALFFKLISPFLGERFQYFGMYQCFCYAAQGFFAAILVWQLTKDRLYAVIASPLLIICSCFIERGFHHTALASHWLLLAAMVLYFYMKDSLRLKSAALFWTLLLCAAIGIHPYLFAMVFGVFFISWVESFIKNRTDTLRFIPFFLTGIIVPLLLGFILGIFGTRLSPGSGFGTYGLNLNAIFNPVHSELDKWASLLPDRPIRSETIDGSFYLGLPVLIFAVLIILMICFDKQKAKKILKACPGLIILMVLYTVFAFSDQVAFDGEIIFSYPLPDMVRQAAGVFRSSCRFFFLPYYGILLLSAVWIRGILFPKREELAIACCLFLILLQAADIFPGLKAIHTLLKPRYAQWELVNDWNELASRYDTAMTFDRVRDRSLAYWLGKNGFKTNIVITAAIHRNLYWERTAPDRANLLRLLSEGDSLPDRNSIYLISDETGDDRTFPDEQSLSEFLDRVRKNYQGQADLLYLPHEVKYYWVLCPRK